MKTVFDYLNYYGKLSFEECAFNDMDNIVFSTLAYLPLNDVMAFLDIDIKELTRLVLNRSTKEHNSPLKLQAIKILEIISNSKRYKNVVFSNYVYILDKETQFSVVTIRYKKGECFISFKGTDNSLVGWKENLELSYKYPVKAQILASDYLKDTLRFSDKVVYVGGHSKGGNLAMASVMETDRSIYNKIKYVYNNDGPGFLKSEFNSSKYKKMAKKLKMFVPEDSFIGTFLLSLPDFTIVKSSETGIKQHFLTSWNCFGQFLLEGRKSKSSLIIQNRFNSLLEQTTDEDKKVFIDTIFKVLEESEIKYFYELQNFKFSEIMNMVNNARSVDEDSKKLVIDTLKKLMSFDKNKKEK